MLQRKRHWEPNHGVPEPAFLQGLDIQPLPTLNESLCLSISHQYEATWIFLKLSLFLIGWIFKQINFNQRTDHVEAQLSIYFNHYIVSKSTTGL